MYDTRDSMISDKDMEKLLSLARIEVSPEEKAKLIKDVESILSYVSEIENAAEGEAAPNRSVLRNVMREDGEPHESGLFTGALLKAAPKRDGDYIAVKKIL